MKTDLLSGTGNRTYRVRCGDGNVIVRLPGGDTAELVDRAAERHNAAVAAGAGLGPALLHLDPDDGAMVSAEVAGTPLPTLAGARRRAAIGRLGEALSRLHRGPDFHGLMDPWQKLELYLSIAGHAHPGAEAASGPLWRRLGPLRLSASLAPGRLVPCHVDPVPDNVIDTGTAVVLVDWEYAAMSEPLWDLSYASIEGSFDAAEEGALFEGYGTRQIGPERLADWKLAVRTVSAAWCMARAARAGRDAPKWRAETVERLAEIAAALDGRAARRT